jgi:hypothetical protein
MRKRSHHHHSHAVLANGTDASRVTASVTTRERNEALRALGSVVYAARLPDDIIKIGYTTDLATRLLALGADDILAFKPGSYADEQQLHRALVEHRHHGREHYHPTPEVLAVINDMRDLLGLDPIAA